MANPAKRKVTDDPSTDREPAPATPRKPDKVVPPKAKARAKAAAAGDARPATRRPSRRHSGSGPSPRWVPVLMFALWGIGLLLIILNYMGVLPGAADGGNGWYLVAGLVSILGRDHGRHPVPLSRPDEAPRRRSGPRMTLA